LTSVFIRKENAKIVSDYIKKKGYIKLAPDEATEQVLKTNNFMVGLKIKTNHIEPYLEDRGIKVVKEDGG